ncbi:MAG: hypothetical protein WA682_14315, partial [Acidobacteriaceae bacterium]
MLRLLRSRPESVSGAGTYASVGNAVGIAHKNIALCDRFWNRRDFRRLFDAALRSDGLCGSGMRGGSLGRSCG